MSCCSISKAFRKLDAEIGRAGENIQSELIDPVKDEADRIEDKLAAELRRIPDNIDKATEKLKETVSDVFEDIFDFATDIIPGLGALSTFVKVVGIGIGAIIVLSIVRRTGK